MVGCLMGLFMALIGVIIGIIRTILWLVTASVGSVVVGPDQAAERIAESWIEQADGQGVNLGYSPVTRDGAKVGAWILLVFGWILFIAIIILMVWVIANR